METPVTPLFVVKPFYKRTGVSIIETWRGKGLHACMIMSIATGAVLRVI
jgi:hypothetical protein